jgi:Thioesterase-like superfamily
VTPFEKATAVRGSDGSYATELDPMWTVGGRPNGGYLLATMARAAIAADDEGMHPHPLTASAVFVSSPEVGPAQISVGMLRRGRLASHVRARLSQDDTVRVETLFTLGRIDPDVTPTFDSTEPVEVAPPEQCRLGLVEPPGLGMRVEMLGQVEQRIDRRALHDPAFAGDLRGWLAFSDDAPFDPVSLLFAADSFPPSTVGLGSLGWAPTLELTAYIREIPAPGTLRVRQRARVLSGGLVDQICEVWDTRGRRVAQAIQLAAVRMAR